VCSFYWLYCVGQMSVNEKKKSNADKMSFLPVLFFIPFEFIFSFIAFIIVFRELLKRVWCLFIHTAENRIGARDDVSLFWFVVHSRLPIDFDRCKIRVTVKTIILFYRLCSEPLPVYIHDINTTVYYILYFTSEERISYYNIIYAVCIRDSTLHIIVYTSDFPKRINDITIIYRSKFFIFLYILLFSRLSSESERVWRIAYYNNIITVL